MPEEHKQEIAEALESLRTRARRIRRLLERFEEHIERTAKVLEKKAPPE